MKPYIAHMSSPLSEGRKDPASHGKLIVISDSETSAEATLKSAAVQDWTITMSNEKPTQEYLKAADLQPGVVKSYSP